ncbi:VOC family protein [Enterococcus sp. DIV0086]|uniref:VOC family protein n=1 Tax=Enterococcus sp. DIV0086 TaxID=2774655 RepID=UPI003D290595
MIDHFSIKVSDLKKSKDFYKQTLYPLGYKICFDTDYVISFVSPEGADPAGDFWISQGEPSGNHFAFTSNTKESVDLFYESGLKAGGITNGSPGFRPQYHENYYAAFLLDPDGYNIEAVCHN